MEYILNKSIWRCGGASGNKNALGFGRTELLNKEGYMCCLGQFCKQEGVPDRQLIYACTPFNLSTETTFSNVSLAQELIDINDNAYSCIQEKVKMIEEVLNELGHTLKVIES